MGFGMDYIDDDAYDVETEPCEFCGKDHRDCECGEGE